MDNYVSEVTLQMVVMISPTPKVVPTTPLMILLLKYLTSK